MSGKPNLKQASKRARQTEIDHRLMKALTHPLRQSILFILNEREASPKELSDQLKEDLSKTSYHVKVLREYECIELVRTEPRRGATEHYYKALSPSYISDESSKALPPSVRNGISASLLSAIVDDATDALCAGTLDAREDRNLTWVPMEVDEEGWGELVEFGAAALEKALEIRAANLDRLRTAGAEGSPATLTVMGYEAKSGRRKVGPLSKS
jgi:DNA-binding transcriptional ArsR family regulator